jgi:phosphoribosylglycinamide formyltransferase-1
LNTHQRVVKANAKQHGVTVHLVTTEVDSGPIILQAALSVTPDEDAHDLANRVLQLEHQLFPFILKNLCEGKLTLTEDKVIWHQQELYLEATDSTGSHFVQTLRWPDSQQL